MHMGFCPGYVAVGEVTCLAFYRDLKFESYMQSMDYQPVSLRDKVHKGRSHDHTYVAVMMTSEKTPSHMRDTGEAWVMCVLVPDGATVQLQTGSLFHTLDNHMGMLAASDSVFVALSQPVQ